MTMDANNGKPRKGLFLRSHKSDKTETYVTINEKFIENERKIVRKHREMIASMALYC